MGPCLFHNQIVRIPNRVGVIWPGPSTGLGPTVSSFTQTFIPKIRIRNADWTYGIVYFPVGYHFPSRNLCAFRPRI